MAVSKTKGREAFMSEPKFKIGDIFDLPDIFDKAKRYKIIEVNNYNNKHDPSPYCYKLIEVNGNDDSWAEYTELALLSAIEPAVPANNVDLVNHPPHYTAHPSRS